jgi:Flp pilus assembly protein CpaB
MSVSINDVRGVTGFALLGGCVDTMLTRDRMPTFCSRTIKFLASDQTPAIRQDGRPWRSTASTPRS